MLQEKKIAKLSLLSKTLLASERAKSAAKSEKKEELHDNNSTTATEVTFVSSLSYKNKSLFDNLTTKCLTTCVIRKYCFTNVEAASRNFHFRPATKGFGSC